MANSYIEYSFKIKPVNPGNEILIAELSEVGFESFTETDQGLSAYIRKENDFPDLLKPVRILNTDDFDVSYRTKEIIDKDWNEEWEKQFKPIDIDKTCRIRSSFHIKKKVKYDIIIDPKMAFGTGHHATTHLMLSYILEENIANKKILDMGCGTGVLSILSVMKGAQSIDAIDIDLWSYQNTLENIKLNQCNNISVFQGDAELLTGKTYDIVFANINRNILLNDIPTYTKCLNKNGSLFLSGFYKKDLPLIQKKIEEFGIQYQSHKTRQDWVALKSIKS